VRTDIGEEATETTKEKEKLDGSVERTVVCFAALLRRFHANEEEEEPYLKS
jgi:hypothetical protein